MTGELTGFGRAFFRRVWSERLDEMDEIPLDR